MTATTSPERTPSTELQDAQIFLANLFGEAVDREHAIVTWDKGGGAAKAHFNVDSAAGETIRRAAERDAYISCCLHDSTRIERGSRGTAQTVSAVVACYADIDVASEGKKKTYPPTREDAMRELGRALPLVPSIVVDSGGGLQAWWILHEPWMIESDEDRIRAGRMTQGLVARIRAHWSSLGWDVDSVGDLARVLRCPGTLNHKYGEPLPVSVVWRAPHDARYDPSDIEEWCEATITADVVASREAIQAAAAGLMLRAGAQPPLAKLMALQATSAKFDATWRRERSDLVDQSQSCYDMALAALAAGAAWSDQEIVDLLVAHREAGGGSSKIDRPDYYARTLGKVRSESGRARAREALTDRVDSVSGGLESPADARSGHLRDLRAVLGIEVCAIEKYLGDPPIFFLRLPQGQITLGDVKTILKSDAFHAAVAAVAGVVLPRFKRPQWDTVAQAILQAAEVVDIGTQTESILEEWLIGYTRRYTPIRDRDKAIVTNCPWIDSEGCIHVRAQAVRMSLRYEMDEKVTVGALARMLRACGAERRVWAWKTSNGARSTVSMWRLPRGGRFGNFAPLGVVGKNEEGLDQIDDPAKR